MITNKRERFKQGVVVTGKTVLAVVLTALLAKIRLHARFFVPPDPPGVRAVKSNPAGR